MKNDHQIITASYAVVSICMLFLITAAGYFVYRNFNDALASTSELVTLRSIVAPETINIRGWKNVLEKIEEKHHSTLAAIELADPFDPARLE